MFLQIILIIIAFLATILGVTANTTDPDKRGFKRITLPGYISLALAFFACVISIVQIATQTKEQDSRKIDAYEKIKLIAFTIRHNISIASIFQETNGLLRTQQDLQIEFDKSVKELEHIMLVYKEVIPVKLLKVVNRLRDLLKNDQYIEDPIRSYRHLDELNYAIMEMSQLLQDSSMLHVSRKYPLTMFQLDYQDSIPH